MTNYGYIGLGQMGSAMTERILSTNASVTVFDLDARAMESAVEQGATPAASVKAVASKADILSICVPAAEHIEAVLTGLAEAANADCTLLIHSTLSPATMQAAQTTAGKWGAQCFDVCVAGGSDAARSGDLVIFAGGVADMSAAVNRLLGIYASKVIDAGPVGAGAALKIGCNVMTYAQQAAAKAAFGLVEASGASTDALVEAWRHIGQLGKLTEQMLGLLTLPGEQIQGDLRQALLGTVAIEQKDLELAAAMQGNPEVLTQWLKATRNAIPTIIGVAGE